MSTAVTQLQVRNETKDIIYVTSTAQALSSAPDQSAFVIPGQTFSSEAYTGEVRYAVLPEGAAGAAFLVLRFSGRGDAASLKASTFKDLVKGADSAVSVIYGGNVPQPGGPAQIQEQSFTDGPTTVVMDTHDGYTFQAFVTDTTRATPATGIIVAIAVTACLAIFFAIGTFHLRREMGVEHAALKAAEPGRLKGPEFLPQ